MCHRAPEPSHPTPFAATSPLEKSARTREPDVETLFVKRTR